MKNPDNKPLRVVFNTDCKFLHNAINSGRTLQIAEVEYLNGYTNALAQLAIAQSNLAKQGKDSAMPHFIAIVKELERVYGFRFEIADV